MRWRTSNGAGHQNGPPANGDPGSNHFPHDAWRPRTSLARRSRSRLRNVKGGKVLPRMRGRRALPAGHRSKDRDTCHRGLNFFGGPVAQLAELSAHNRLVLRSNRSGPTIQKAVTQLRGGGFIFYQYIFNQSEPSLSPESCGSGARS